MLYDDGLVAPEFLGVKSHFTDWETEAEKGKECSVFYWPSGLWVAASCRLFPSLCP